MKDVLLRLVGHAPRASLRSEGSGTSRLQHEEPLERVEPGAGPAPVVVAVPLELGLHRLRHTTAVDISEPAQEPARHSDTEGVDELLPQKPLGDAIEDEGALAGEVDQPPSGVQLQKFLQVKGFDAHPSPFA